MAPRAPRPRYVPILALPYWGTIGPFVESAVAECMQVGERRERDLFAAATPMVLWAWQSRGASLQRRKIFRRSMIEQFIHLGMPGSPPGTQATYRSALWRMTEILNPAGLLGGHRPIPRSQPTSPYSTEEIAELYSWAKAQGTPARCRNALALLCFGLGAGLATRELLDVRDTDISIDIDAHGDFAARVVVWRDRPRVVPFRTEWTRTLATVMTGAAGQGWVFRPGRTSTSPGQVTDFLTRNRTQLDVRPSRMRTTWLLEHLTEGMPAADLLTISGLQNYAALDKIAALRPQPFGSKKSLKNF